MKIGDLPDAAYMELKQGVIHVYPLDGPLHAPGEECWCRPRWEPDRSVLVHNEATDA